ncbi:MAG: BA14K family protein [Bauldia sp.]
MKKIAALGLAVAMAATATLAVTASADAKPYWPHPGYFPHQNFHPHNGFYLSTPFFFGFSFGPQYQRPYYPRYAGGGNLHVQWCASHYKTYNPYTNTFFIKKGVPATCYSPYWH